MDFVGAQAGHAQDLVELGPTVQHAAVLEELLPVIGREDDPRRVAQAELVELREQPPEPVVPLPDPGLTLTLYSDEDSDEGLEQEVEWGEFCGLVRAPEATGPGGAATPAWSPVGAGGATGLVLEYDAASVSEETLPLRTDGVHHPRAHALYAAAGAYLKGARTQPQTQ